MNRTGVFAVLATLLATHTEAQVMRPVLRLAGEHTTSVTIDDPGTSIYAVSSTNQFGTNPDYLRQIVRWDPVTGAGTPITDFEEGVTSVSVSDDGSWLAFVSRADLVGTNQDESPELYVMHPDGTGIAQLTFGSFLPPRDRGVEAAFISGSGNRVAFVGRIDPLGLNPQLQSALFVIDRGGANLRQLELGFVLSTQASVKYSAIDISDDGNRIVYIGGGGGIGINADGTGKHSFSSTGSMAEVVLSGNGERIAYASGGSGTHNVCTRTFDGDPTTIVCISNGESPAFTDDASFVYYYRTDTAGIWRFPGTGGAPTLVSPGHQMVRVSGSGNRVVARGTELLAMDGAGGSLQQLTTTTVPAPGGLDVASTLSLSPDASSFYFSSKMNPLGTNSAREYEQFAFSIGTGQFSQLTDGSLPVISPPSFSDVGSIVFWSGSNLTGQNPCARYQIFRWEPGGPLTQLTACSGSIDSFYPTVSADGQVVAFVLVDTRIKMYSMHGDGSAPTLLTPISNGPAYDDHVFEVGSGGSPTWVTFSAHMIAGGANQVFRVRSDGTGLQQVTSGTESFFPALSSNGERLAFLSLGGNYTGENADGSAEVFAFDAPTATFRQLTNDDPGAVGDGIPRVTRDGNYVFLADGRYNMTTSLLEPAAARFYPAYKGLVPDATGSRWLIDVREQLNHQGIFSPYHQTLFLADMTAVPTFSVAKTSPTELSWDPSPTSLRYDAIRGSIANLSTTGATVKLGPVACLEDDSPDAHTRGHGDPAEPGLGEAFFFLYRGSVGFEATAGSYGQGTGGKERLPSSGGCAP